MASLVKEIEHEIVQILRDLPEQSAVEVRNFAQFLAHKEAASLRMDESALTAWDKQAAVIDQEQRAFESQHSELLQQYRGCYIAMVDGQVIDNDLDRMALRRRIRQRYGEAPVLITLVDEEPIQTVRVRSPRFVADV